LSWPEVQLRRIARFAYGDSLADAERIAGAVPVYGSNGQVGQHNRANTDGPAIVIGRKGSFGKLQFSTNPVFAIDTTFFVDATRTDADLRWLYYALGTLRLDQLSEDVGVPGLSREKAYSQRLPLPPLDEQRAIADYLDRETARIDALIAAKQRMSELLAERFMELIEARLWDAALAPISAIKRHLKQKITDGPHETPEFVDEGIPFVSIEAVVNDELDFSRARFISLHAHVEYSRKVAPKRGDVLLAKTGATIGKAAVVRTDASFSIWSPLALLRPRADTLRPEYLWYVLRTRSAQSMIREFATQSTQPNVSMPDIAALPIRVPRLTAQDSILAEFREHMATSEPFRQALTRQLVLLQERRQALITGAVTGQIEVPVAA
jgi:type I restriction enzyme S subunit